MNTLEKVARAIQQGASGRKILPPWELMAWYDRERWKEAARAALEALLEPGDDILFVGADASRVDEGGYEEAKVVFHAMIQAVLEGQ